MRAALVIAGLLTLASAPAMAQAAGQTIKVAGWEIRRDSSATAQSCTAAATASDNVSLVFGANTQDKTFIMLIDPQLKLKIGQSYGFEYHVDTGKVYKTTADAVAATGMLQIVGSFTDAGPLFTSVENGDTMHFATNGETYDFSLDGSKEALAALAACVKAAM